MREFFFAGVQPSKFCFQGLISHVSAANTPCSVLSNAQQFLAVPMIDDVLQVPTTLQTAIIHSVPCGSSSGVAMTFNKVEVVWKVSSANGAWRLVKEHGRSFQKLWITDQVKSQVSQLCSKHSVADLFIHLFASMDEAIQQALTKILTKWAPDISVLSVRTTKPQLPKLLADEYSAVEDARARLAVVVQQQATAVGKALNEAKRRLLEAERALEIARIDAARKLETASSRKEIADIDNSMLLARAKQHADAQYERAVRAAEDEQALLSPEYLENLRAKALFNSNTEAYFGDKVPRVIFE